MMHRVLLFCSLLCFMQACINADVSAGQALFLTPYLPQNASLARQLAQVKGVGYNVSYSGYFTVNPKFGSNTFFWYFPPQNGNTSAPTLLWLQGGPGSSSMFGLFQENGPISASPDGSTWISKNVTWNEKYGLVYFDNPVGSGFSFTQSESGYVTNEDEVANDLYSAVIQFFQLFPNLLNNDFYVTGESYAGKYVPALSYKLHTMNKQENTTKIPFVGLSIGDGMVDPTIQTQGLADLLYYFSMVDDDERDQGRMFEKRIAAGINAQQWTDAFNAFDEYINGDFFPYPTFYNNVSGLTNYFNFLAPLYAPNYYQRFVDLNSTRAAIHVGEVPYFDYNSTVEFHLIQDWMKSVFNLMPTLLNNYKVLLYNGQNDIILAGPLAENYIRTIPWKGQNEYLRSKRIVWKVSDADREPAGYVKTTGEFVYVQVRDAGHLVPLDQPIRAKDMIERFIDGRSFVN